MEHLYKRRRNAAVQTNPVPKPYIKQFFFCQILFSWIIPIKSLFVKYKNIEKIPKNIQKPYTNVLKMYIMFG